MLKGSSVLPTFNFPAGRSFCLDSKEENGKINGTAMPAKKFKNSSDLTYDTDRFGGSSDSSNTIMNKHWSLLCGDEAIK